VEEYRYYSNSAHDIRIVPIGVLSVRLHNFRQIHETDVRFRAKTGGLKIG